MDVALTRRKLNKGRDPERLALKFSKMRASPFIFLRGSCHLFYQRLPVEQALEKAPRVWACGDLHLENFGSFKGDNRLTYFDMNDFDEAALAPCTWDVARFLTSVRLGMREMKVEASAIASLCQVFLDSYARELATGKARWIEREASEGLVKELLSAVQLRSRPEFLDTRTQRKGKRRTILADGHKALPAGNVQRQQVTAFMEDFASRQ